MLNEDPDWVLHRTLDVYFGKKPGFKHGGQITYELLGGDFMRFTLEKNVYKRKYAWRGSKCKKCGPYPFSPAPEKCPECGSEFVMNFSEAWECVDGFIKDVPDDVIDWLMFIEECRESRKQRRNRNGN